VPVTKIDTILKTKKIYLIRHGQTDFNKKGIVQGRGVDSSLNDVGRDQALRFHQHYHSVPFDKIYTSSLTRTVETVSGFIDRGIEHTKLEGLDEIHWGSKEGKPFDAQDHHEYLQVTSDWSQGNTHIRIAGGESPDEVILRQKESLEHIISNEREQTVLICMHGRAMRIFLCLLLNYPLKHMNVFPHYNTGLYKITYTGNLFRIDIINSLLHLNGTDV
jgi:probable phosphoglycerate mutase